MNTIPLLDQVAADCLRGMLADQYFKPDAKQDGAVQAYRLARALLRPYFPDADKANSPTEPIEVVISLHLQFARAALSGMLANPHIRHQSAQAWADAAHEWAHVMIDARTTS